MAKRKPTAEQIIGKLREAEVLLAQGQTVAQVSRALSVSEQSFYRWRAEYGGLKVDQAKRLRSWSARTRGCAKRWPTSSSTS